MVELWRNEGRIRAARRRSEGGLGGACGGRGGRGGGGREGGPRTRSVRPVSFMSHPRSIVSLAGGLPSDVGGRAARERMAGRGGGAAPCALPWPFVGRRLPAGLPAGRPAWPSPRRALSVRRLGWSAGALVASLVGWRLGWLVGWRLGWWVGALVGGLAPWLLGWRLGWLVGWRPWLVGWRLGALESFGPLAPWPVAGIKVETKLDFSLVWCPSR